MITPGSRHSHCYRIDPGFLGLLAGPEFPGTTGHWAVAGRDHSLRSPGDHRSPLPEGRNQPVIEKLGRRSCQVAHYIDL